MSKKPKLNLTVQYADKRLHQTFTLSTLKKIVQAALFVPATITLRFVDAEEGQLLNRDYRGKDYATNVLTFEYGVDEDEIIQADIVLCVDVAIDEAAQQNRSINDHVCHLIVHGVLHAQGYDHEHDEEAREMEALEVQILETLGVGNPY